VIKNLENTRFLFVYLFEDRLAERIEEKKNIVSNSMYQKGFLLHF
jgi:hypothetical protein